MPLDFTAPARMKWHPDEEEPPEDWSDALSFPSLHEALEAIVTGTPLTGHPWVLCGSHVIAPHDVEQLWWSRE